MNCFIYVISIATCKPNFHVFIDNEVNFACSFYNTLTGTKNEFFHGVFLSVDLRVKRFNVTKRDTNLKCCLNFGNFS
ncbi:unnamed protein product [Tenebrio molitor]|nr:unnamed protein product [Tenebrio molitor]